MPRVDTQKLQIPNKTYRSWQDMLEILAQFARVPIASINRLSANQLEVYCVNHNPNNPYRVGTALPLNGEQFCETVLKNDKVFRIKNALESSDWHKKSPVVNLGIRAYLGIPIHWPNGSPFGTLSIHDVKPNQFKPQVLELLSVFKDSVEAQLTVIYQNQKLQRNNEALMSRIHNRTVELASLSYQLDQEASRRKQLEREVHYQQYHDIGSGLLNAKAWELESNRLINQTDLYNQEIAVFYVGISNGARIQTELGAEALDNVIKQLKEKLGRLGHFKQIVARPHSSDIAYTLVNPISNSQYDSTIQRVLDTTSQEFQVGENSLRLQAYIGVSVTEPHAGQRNLGVTVQARQAMQSAQESGKRILFFDEASIDSGTRFNRMESYFMESLRDQTLSLHFQPQVSVHSGLWESATTSVHWDHPILGSVSELSINQMCDQPDLADAMCQFLVHKAMETAVKWRKHNPDFRIAIKLSASQFASKLLPEILQTNLNQFKLPTDAIELEISEKNLVANEAALSSALDDLSKMGITLTMSDFGHGHASFSYLKHSPFKRIKIDKSFTYNLQHSSEDRAFLYSLMQIIEKLKLDPVLTGIETQEQEQWLMQFNTPFAEGEKYQSPIDSKEFEQALSRQALSIQTYSAIR
ncbi:sensor domain-containing diguanylate cyclase [Vibrio ishigakensis]|nr:EAL domain-containing protein [Vibrio ishigakensis]